MNERELKRLREAEKERQLEIEEGVMRMFNKWTRRICITFTVGTLGMPFQLGRWIAHNSDRALKAVEILLGGDGPK